MNKIGSIKDKNILFLQGPIGPFFKKLDNHFRARGANTFRITLNLADWYFSNKDNTTPFKGTTKEWLDFITLFLQTHKIDKVFLAGDCRFYQRQTIEATSKLDIDTFVFEEGYIRPDYITMEKYGVNNFSKISRDRNFYLALDDKYMYSSTPLPVLTSYRKMEMSAIIYYCILFVSKLSYPHYVHYRESNAINEFIWGIRNIYRKGLFKILESKKIDLLTTSLSKKYYFVPLQTYNDFQITEHSKYAKIEAFIIEVLHSFKTYAPKDTHIVLKHHPVDRGRKNYTKLIKRLSKKLDITDRVIIIYDIHLPTVIKHAIATVTINSTVGISSLYHKIPTITLGDAIYDIEGLTTKGVSLDNFWTRYKKPDDILFKKFRNYLIEVTQLNGSFYGRFPIEFDDDDMYRD